MTTDVLEDLRRALSVLDSKYGHDAVAAEHAKLATTSNAKPGRRRHSLSQKLPIWAVLEFRLLTQKENKLATARRLAADLWRWTANGRYSETRLLGIHGEVAKAIAQSSDVADVGRRLLGVIEALDGMPTAAGSRGARGLLREPSRRGYICPHHTRDSIADMGNFQRPDH
jgi:hypothetical protein